MTHHVTHRHVVTWFRDTKKQLVPRDYWYHKITGANKMLVHRTSTTKK